MSQRTFDRNLSNPLLRLSAIAAIAAGALGASVSSHAGGGEALDIEIPSMRTPIEAVTPVAAATTQTVAHPQMVADLYAEASPPSRAQMRPVPLLTATAPTEAAVQTLAVANMDTTPLTRAEVQSELRTARATNTMTPSGEIGDTTEVLQAREKFYVMQTDAIYAEYAAAAQREMDARLAQQTLEQEQRALEQQALTPSSTEPQAADAPQVISQADTAVGDAVVESNMTIGELVTYLDKTNARDVVVVVEEQEAD